MMNGKGVAAGLVCRSCTTGFSLSRGTGHRFVWPVRFLHSPAILFLLAAIPVTSWAQGGPPKPSGGGAASPDNSLGFAIESEMLTYHALESNSEAVACDIAAYFSGGTADFTNPPAGAICTVRGGSNKKVGVVIAPFDDNIINNFRLWRADMEIMSDLSARATTYCPESSVLSTGSRGAGPGTPSTTTPSGLTQALTMLTPGGTALSLAQNVLGMFASDTTNSAVGGTVHDDAFMDGVGRELRSLNVAVLMPSVYVPYAMTATDASRSPFLSSLDKLLRARACLSGVEAKSDTSLSDKASIVQIVADIDAYLATLRAGAPSFPKPAGTTQPSAATPSGTGTTAAPATPTPGANALTSQSLLAVLSADDLAQKLGIDSTTGLPTTTSENTWQHILLLKALESGGTVAKSSNILGTKIRYSGGSVGTYALFTIDGELECSGNVYAYGGSLPEKKFQLELRNDKADPSHQFIFQRGSCRPTAGH